MTYTYAGVECVLACILECVSQKSRQVICDLVEGITEEKGQVHSGLDCKGVGGVREKKCPVGAQRARLAKSGTFPLHLPDTHIHRESMHVAV